MNRSIVAALGLIFGLLACGEEHKISSNLDYHVADAPEWTNLFKRTQGWFGGDGIFTISRKGKKNLILFSDTMIGEIKEGVLQSGYHMVNNSVAFLEGSSPLESNISFQWDPALEGNEGKTLFIPKLENKEENEYYWLGHGFEDPENGKTYIFTYRIIDHPEWTDELFKFEFWGGALISIDEQSSYPYADHRQIELPFFVRKKGADTSYGAGVLINTSQENRINADGFIYIYGIKDPGKQMVVARVAPGEIEEMDRWRFWSDGGWSPDFMNAIGVRDSVSNELSVSVLPNGKYACVFQVLGVSAKVGMSIGETPYGPFGPIQEIWDCKDAIEDPAFFAYNAKAHPALSKEGELLVSYNVNSFKFWDQIETYPQLYRPRFFKMVFE